MANTLQDKNSLLHKGINIVSNIYEGSYSKVFIVKSLHGEKQMVLKVYNQCDQI